MFDKLTVHNEKSSQGQCDESKPLCNRCKIRGRECVYGGTSQLPLTHNVITIYVPTVPKQPTLFAPAEGIDFYCHNVASEISGPFDSDFWATLILQLSQIKPAIRHAITAISAAHKNIAIAHSNPLALQESATAMRVLSKRIENDPNSHLVPLVACLLFTCLEFMRGNVDSALVQMLNGFKIIEASRQSNNIMKPGPILHMDTDTIEKRIVPVLSRLSVLCLTFGQSFPLLKCDSCSARRRLQDTYRGAAVVSTIKAHTFNVLLEDYSGQFVLQCQLQQWRNDFEALLVKLNSSDRESLANAIILLRIHHRSIFIWLSVCLTDECCATDIFTNDFADIVQLASQITGQIDAAPKSPSSNASDFSFEKQTIPPLYYTAIKCRSPSIRRRAMELIRKAPRRGGLWSAHISSKLAERVIEVEEGGLPIGPEFPLDACFILVKWFQPSVHVFG
ncbi:hypothetical protein EJ08DRAFT_726275 [Tothia fuscella]|uniref:Zn(2)-C6 fungal-type domain-containing protein n=1 Tax=Tothia fuscella TaxID=1048955 RepID=A0A9P4NIC2_9PEZI|nr:hypothetical protein EJ08DRAFT_726275 [Tothia fuscella]